MNRHRSEVVKFDARPAMFLLAIIAVILVGLMLAGYAATTTRATPAYVEPVVSVSPVVTAASVALPATRVEVATTAAPKAEVKAEVVKAAAPKATPKATPKAVVAKPVKKEPVVTPKAEPKAAAVEPVLAPCDEEDDELLSGGKAVTACYWDAKVHGTGKGTSFVKYSTDTGVAFKYLG